MIAIPTAARGTATDLRLALGAAAAWLAVAVCAGRATGVVVAVAVCALMTGLTAMVAATVAVRRGRAGRGRAASAVGFAALCTALVLIPFAGRLYHARASPLVPMSRRTRRRTWMVSAWLTALISREGATTVTSPTSPSFSASARMPGASMPSSFVTRISRMANVSSGQQHFTGTGMVGTAGFEPTTTCTPSKCATRLRYVPFPFRSRRVLDFRASETRRIARAEFGGQ